jgi:putative phosphoesterase
MKLAVVSDTHGRWESFAARLEAIGGADRILHLGDHTKDAANIEANMNIPVICVRGNNDRFDRTTPLEVSGSVGGIRFYATHGNRFGVYESRLPVAARAAELGCQLAFYGHTHIFRDETILGVRVMNPGSPSVPRGEAPGFLIVTFGEKLAIERILCVENP